MANNPEIKEDSKMVNEILKNDEKSIADKFFSEIKDNKVPKEIVSFDELID